MRFHHKLTHYLLTLIFLVAVFVFSSEFVSAQTNFSPPEEITSFTSHLDVLQDTSLEITETITYRTDSPKHGIYRYIPTKLITEDGTRNFKISVISLTDPKGDDYQYEKIMENDNLTLKIGDPDTTFDGEKRYVIRYKVDHVIDKLADYDQLYWDIVGEGWSFPINNITVEINSPYADISSLDCYTGQYGSTDQDCEIQPISPQTYQIKSTQTLPANSNLTILTKFNQKNQLIFPSQLERLGFSWWIWPLIALIPLPGIFMTIRWWQKGRDWISNSPHVLIESSQYGKRRRWLFERFQTPFIYEPFTDLTPAEVEAIGQETISSKSLVAEIVDLARKKYLKIITTEKKKLFGKKTEYTLEKLKSDKGLNAHQKYLLNALFASGDSVQLKDLKGSFYTKVETWKKQVWTTINEGNYFSEKPSQAKLKAFLLAGVLVAVAWAAWIVVEAKLLTTLPYLLAVLVPSSIIALIIPYFMPQKTVEGWRVQQMAAGLKKTIERGKWREEIKEKHLFIEEVFPFAVSMGVVDKLAKDMDDIGETPPDYVGGRGFTGVQMAAFSSSFASATSSNLTYNPSSSHGGSGGGGGFSGGGGGGGGGGSW